MAPIIRERDSSPHTVSSDIYCQKITKQNLKYKTDYCKFFLRGVTCKYGDACHYAHGDHELRRYKADELENLGLTKNLDSFRLYPCLNFVSTGSW